MMTRRVRPPLDEFAAHWREVKDRLGYRAPNGGIAGELARHYDVSVSTVNNWIMMARRSGDITESSPHSPNVSEEQRAAHAAAREKKAAARAAARKPKSNLPPGWEKKAPEPEKVRKDSGGALATTTTYRLPEPLPDALVERVRRLVSREPDAEQLAECLGVSK